MPAHQRIFLPQESPSSGFCTGQCVGLRQRSLLQPFGFRAIAGRALSSPPFSRAHRYEGDDPDPLVRALPIGPLRPVSVIEADQAPVGLPKVPGPSQRPQEPRYGNPKRGLRICGVRRLIRTSPARCEPSGTPTLPDPTLAQLARHLLGQPLWRNTRARTPCLSPIREERARRRLVERRKSCVPSARRLVASS